MAAFPFVDVDVGIVNEYILGARGVVKGFGQTMISFFDPTFGLPVAPADGDKYISLATANGWVINDIEVFDAKTGLWRNVEPISGTIAWIDALAPPQLQMWDSTGVAWVSLAIGIGAVLAVPSTDEAIVRFDGVAGQVQNSGVLLDDANNITGINDMTVNGKLTVVGLIDPTGLQLTPVAANPGSIAANTIWQDSTNGNRWTINANPLTLGPTGVVPVNMLPSFASATTLQITPVTLDTLGNVLGLQDVQILGDVSIGGVLDLPQIATPAAPAAGITRVSAIPGGPLRVGTSTTSYGLTSSTFITASTVYTIPTDARQILATFCGGGGGGGTTLNGALSGGGGGAAGSAVVDYPIPTTGVTTLTITIGAGGGFNVAGGNSSIAWTDASANAYTITAFGGGPGGDSSTLLGVPRAGGGGGGGGGSNAVGSAGANAAAAPVVPAAGGAGGAAQASATGTNRGLYGAAGGTGGDSALFTGVLTAATAASDGSYIGGYAVGGAGGGGGGTIDVGGTGSNGGNSILGYAGGAGVTIGGGGGGGLFGPGADAGTSAAANTGAGGGGQTTVFLPVGSGGSGACLLVIIF